MTFVPLLPAAATLQSPVLSAGRALANDAGWPGWYPGVEYGAVAR